MNLIVMAMALLLAAFFQQAWPSLPLLGQAKAPIVLSVVIYYALQRSLGLMAIAAIAGGVLCDSLEGLPMGYSATVFSALGIAAGLCRNLIFSARTLTHMVIGFAAGLGLTLGFYALLLVSEERIGEFSGLGIIFKALGSALLGMLLAPLVFAILERLDRWMGNTIEESSL